LELHEEETVQREAQFINRAESHDHAFVPESHHTRRSSSWADHKAE